YNVSNAQSYSDIKVVYSYCYVRSNGCNNGFSSLKIAINPDGTNLNQGEYTAYANSAIFCRKDSMIATDDPNGFGAKRKVGANGTISIYFNNAGTSNDTCKVIGFKSIEVWGTPKPKIKGGDGEVCTKEKIELMPQNSYSNVDFLWQVQVGSSTAWQDIGTSIGNNYEPFTDDIYRFRLTLTTKDVPRRTFFSDTLTVASITCCMENGVPASRKTIYYDDFGRLNPNDPSGRTYYTTDYTDIKNPKEILNTTSTPFKWKATPEPVGHIFEGGANTPPIDGEYVVAANLTTANLQWANNITGYATQPQISYDRSGTKDGGVLLINVCDNCKDKTLYDRNITDICFGKKIYFEGYFTVFSNVTPGPDIRIEVTDISANKVRTTQQFTVNPRSENTNTGWRRLSDTITLSGSSLNLKIISNTNGGTGKDLAIDDIRIKVCAPPLLDLYFDTVSLQRIKSTCNLSNVALFSKPTTLLKGYYGSNPHFLYQWTRTPLVAGSWKNMGVPTTSTVLKDIVTAATDTALTKPNPNGPFYFRVIATTSSEFGLRNNFQGDVGDLANPNDPCSNYSVSGVVELDIECVLPTKWLYVNGESTSSGNRLAWAVSTTVRNGYFCIEKSYDGSRFFEIAQVGITLNTNSVFYDKNMGSAYYRIKYISNDGQISYSRTISLDAEQNFLEKLYVFPNPSIGEFIISGLRDPQSAKVNIFDLSGKSIPFIYTVHGDSQIKISGLYKGCYVVRTNTDDFVYNDKIIVH
ncbi:MAG TPA: T9SS type A sorting domain-containing protein, partial [Cytophagales bacterium]|nr:T9SS type A sorting domain-containing protein [Cytophagales bacterium]